MRFSPLAVAVLAAGLLLVRSVPGLAQRPVPDAIPPAGSLSSSWLLAAGVASGALFLALIDEDLQSYIQDNRSSTLDDASGFIGRLGSPEVYLPVGAGLLSAGLLSGNSPLLQSGARVSVSLAVAGVLTRGLKYAAGRDRPSAGVGSDNFHLFTHRTSFPSGHTSMAFALATSVSQEIGRTWASVSLYTLASLVGMSRLNDNVHWLTDVAAGAVLGHLSARLVRSQLSWRGRAASVGPDRIGDGLGVSLRLGL